MARGTLVVMVKEPRPGRVKTRLGREIGMTTAAWWFRHQVAGLLRRLDDPRWDLVLAVAPDREGMSSRVWPGHLPRWPQGRGDLGDRMGRVFRGMPRAGVRGPILITGADIPGIEPGHIGRAFQALGAHDAVIGPAPDGGYWAIGLSGRRAVPPGLLAEVRWSSEHACADTLRSMAGLRVAQIDRLRDVDTAADLGPAAAS